MSEKSKSVVLGLDLELRVFSVVSSARRQSPVASGRSRLSLPQPATTASTQWQHQQQQQQQQQQQLLPPLLQQQREIGSE
ncbi:hypothetical protein ACLKA7_013845 [Drosophila subpalustris]